MNYAQGAYVINWEQTEVDGFVAPAISSIDTGCVWRWHGTAVRVDTNADVLMLEDQQSALRDRLKASSRMRRIMGAPDSLLLTGAIDADETGICDGGFELTDGERAYQATLLFDPENRRAPLVLFNNQMPPAGVDLWVLNFSVSLEPVSGRSKLPETLCFVPGTTISTENGDVPVEQLSVGDRVLTRDNGAQVLRWIGRRDISGARLHVMPWLRPVRIRRGLLGLDEPDQDLILSPDHRVLLTGGAAPELFGETEVLVAAKDLIGNEGINLDHSVRRLSYMHLLFDEHQIVWANRVACESFHPAGTDLSYLDPAQKAELDAVMPGVSQETGLYGDFARRTLATADAAMLAYASQRAI